MAAARLTAPSSASAIFWDSNWSKRTSVSRYVPVESFLTQGKVCRKPWMFPWHMNEIWGLPAIFLLKPIYCLQKGSHGPFGSMIYRMKMWWFCIAISNYQRASRLSEDQETIISIILTVSSDFFQGNHVQPKNDSFLTPDSPIQKCASTELTDGQSWTIRNHLIALAASKFVAGLRIFHCENGKPQKNTEIPTVKRPDDDQPSLLGGSPLKKIRVRQLGWWHSQHTENEKMFQTTNQIWIWYMIKID